MFNECFPIVKVRSVKVRIVFLTICVKSGKRTHEVTESENHVLQERINNLIRAEQIHQFEEVMGYCQYDYQ